MGSVCYRLLQILDNVSNAPRDSAISLTYPQVMECYFLAFDFTNLSAYVMLQQLDLVRVACSQLLQVLGPSYNVSIAAPLGESQVLAIYPQVMEYVIFLRSNLLTLARIGYSHRHTARIRVGRFPSSGTNRCLV